MGADGYRENRDVRTVDPKSSSRNRMVRIGIAFIALVVVCFAVWLFASGTAGSFFEALLQARLPWIAAGFACVTAYILLDVACYGAVGMVTGSRMGLRDLLSVASTGIVFGYLTPGQVGGSPAQIVRLAQVGLKVGDATAVQLTKFFVYQVAVTLFGALVLIAESSYFIECFGDIVLVSVLSFCGHAVIMAGLVAVIFWPDLVRRAGHALVGAASRRTRLVKDPQAWHDRVDGEVDEYAGSVRAAIRRAGVVGTAVVATLLQLACLYCVPYCVLRSLGVDDVDFALMLFSAAFIQLIMTAVPLPGGTGEAEGGFALFYGPELGAMVAVGIVLWRMLTFYLPILLCALMLGLKSRPRRFSRPRARRGDSAGNFQVDATA